MSFIIEHLDVVVAIILSGIVTALGSTWNHRRNRNKERLDRERVFVDEYIKLVSSYFQRLEKAVYDIEMVIPSDNQPFKEIITSDSLSNLSTLEEKLLLSKSEYCYNLDKELDLIVRDIYEEINKKSEELKSANISNIEMKEGLNEFRNFIEDSFEILSNYMRSFYNEKF